MRAPDVRADGSLTVTDPQTEPPAELVEAVAAAVLDEGGRYLADDGAHRDIALAAIAAVRAYDAEQVCGACSPSTARCGLAPHDERVTHTALGGHAVITWTNDEVPA